MEVMLNATLAGGVAIGSSADLAAAPADADPGRPWPKIGWPWFKNQQNYQKHTTHGYII